MPEPIAAYFPLGTLSPDDSGLDSLREVSRPRTAAGIPLRRIS